MSELAVEQAPGVAEPAPGVAGETVELSNHQGSFVFATELESCGESWAVVALSALDFEYLFHQRPIATIEIFGDGGALCFESQAASSLPCG